MAAKRFLLAAAATVLALAAADSAFAQNAPTKTARAAPQIDPARKALGYQLAKLLNDEDATMTLLQRGLAETLPKAMANDPNIKTLEGAYPGILKAMVDSMSPIIVRYMHGELPGLWDKLGDFYAANLTEADLRAAIAFYGSPTGKHMIEIMMTSTDMAPMLNEMVASGNYEVTQSGLRTTAMTGARQVSGKLSPAETAETMRFGLSPEGKHIIALGPRAMAMMAEWSNQPTPAIDAEIEKALTGTIEKFTGKKLGS
jgi:hypothetical protein